MTELERRALLGDREAQRECTIHGIILPCLKCHGEVKINSFAHNGNRMEMCFKCKRCGLELIYGQYLLKSGMDAKTIENPTPLAQYNTRPTPPIGRCGECKYWGGRVCGVHDLMRDETGYCSDFEPKGGEGNAVD